MGVRSDSISRYSLFIDRSLIEESRIFIIFFYWNDYFSLYIQIELISNMKDNV